MSDLIARYQCEHHFFVLENGVEGVTEEPVTFSFVTVEMNLRDTFEFAEQLEGEIGEHGKKIILEGARQCLKEGFGVAQEHMVIFINASDEEVGLVMCGCYSIQKILEDNLPPKTTTMLYTKRSVFDQVLDKLSNLTF